MAVTLVKDVVARAQRLLQDDGTRWPRLEIQDWINEAYVSITLARPDANAKTGNFTCAAGSRQELTRQFPTGLRVLDVTRNMAEASNKRVIRQVERRIIDDQRPRWHTEEETLNIQHYSFDIRQPKEFFLYPSAQAGAEVEVVYADSPGRHTLTEAQLDPEGTDTEVIKLDDIYVTPIVDWVVYRCYLKDAQYAGNAARAQAYFSAFNTALGVKTQADAAVEPQPTSNVT